MLLPRRAGVATGEPAIPLLMRLRLQTMTRPGDAVAVIPSRRKRRNPCPFDAGRYAPRRAILKPTQGVLKRRQAL